MGKNKKKNEEKKAALQARKDAKAGKAAKKRLQKEAKARIPESGSGPTGSAVSLGDEDNLDDLLELYRRKDEAVSTTVLEKMDGFPAPRANFSLTHCDDKNGHVYVFGGEYYDGIQNVVVDELFRFDPQKGDWRRVVTPAPRPSPRCAHSCVYYSGALYVLGGEFGTADEYHHYKDIWRFDLKTLKWEEIQPRSIGTHFSPRSGHSAFLWKHYMVVFGGFYEALRETRWFNDVCVLDLQTNTWLDIPHSKLGTRPEERSACCVGISPGGDTAIIHGGYSKLRNPTAKSESKVHNDSWILHLKPILQGKPPMWERLFIRGKGSSPTGRSGMVAATYKNRMMVFGGVKDEEELHHKVTSVFYNDLLAYDMDRRKWFPVRPRQATQQEAIQGAKTTESMDGKTGTSGKNDDIEKEDTAPKDDDVNRDDVADDKETNDGVVEDDLNEVDELDPNEIENNGWDLAVLRSNLSSFMDGNGNVVYEKMNEDDKAGHPDGKQEATNEGDEEEKEEEKDEEKDEEKEEEEKTETKAESKHVSQLATATTPKVASSAVMKINDDTGNPEAVSRTEPLPRINAGIVVRSNVLYVYGGLLEVGDREVTLDDCWSLNLRKQDRWVCLWEGTMHKQIWRGAVHDDDDSYVSTGTGGGLGDHDDDDDDDDEEEKDDNEGQEGGTGEDQGKSGKKKSKRRAIRERIKSLKEQLDLDEQERTPQVGESLADFYSRTVSYWSQQAAAAQEEDTSESTNQGEPLSEKELKREGFALAQIRYSELEPVLKELDDLDRQQRGGEKKNDNEDDDDDDDNDDDGNYRDKKKSSKKKKKKKNK